MTIAIIFHIPEHFTINKLTSLAGCVAVRIWITFCESIFGYTYHNSLRRCRTTFSWGPKANRNWSKTSSQKSAWLNSSCHKLSEATREWSLMFSTCFSRHGTTYHGIIRKNRYLLEMQNIASLWYNISGT